MEFGAENGFIIRTQSRDDEGTGANLGPTQSAYDQRVQDRDEQAREFDRQQMIIQDREENIEKRKKGEPTVHLEHSRKTFKKLHEKLMGKFGEVGVREKLPQEKPVAPEGGMRRRKTRRKLRKRRRKSRKKRRKSRKSKKTKRRRRRRRRK